MNLATAKPVHAIGSKVECTLSIHNVIWYHPLRGAIFTGHDENGVHHTVRASPLRTATMARRVGKGEIWRIDGFWESYRGNEQILAIRCTLTKPTNGKLLVRYLKDNFTGIGERRAQTLLSFFNEQGKNLSCILDSKDVGSLLDVLPTLESAEVLVRQWHEKMAETRVVIGLEALGVPMSLSSRLLRIWGEDALEVIQTNPYFLLTFVSWDKVEKIASSLGLGSRDVRRLVGAVEAALYDRLDNKSTITGHVALRTRVINLLNRSLHIFPQWSRAGVQIGEHSIASALDGGAAVGDRAKGYQTRTVSMMEKYLVDRINEMINGEKPAQSRLFDANGQARANTWDQLLDSLFDGEYLTQVFKNYEDFKHRLTEEQREAIISVIEHEIMVLKGGAGTGKTSVMCVIHDMIEGKGGTVYQMALSGRAKERMREATGREAVTIAKFLRDAHNGKISIQSDDLIIVDEASMTGLSTLYRLFKVIPKGARLLLVGDPGQLPPIEFGLTFHVLADKISKVHKVELTQVHRQSFQTGIPQIANDIRDGKIPVLPKYEGMKEGVSFVDCDPEIMVDAMFNIYTELGGSEQAQIIGTVKGGKAGTLVTNSWFQKKLTSVEGRESIGLVMEQFAVGDPIIYLENDVHLDLYNGTFGKVVAIRRCGSTPSLICQFQGKCEPDIIEASDLYKLSLAYAVTTHKAQGSQFACVIIPILRSRILDRTMIYTALTRAKRQVVFIGNRALLDAAIIALPSVATRDVGFRI